MLTGDEEVDGRSSDARLTAAVRRAQCVPRLTLIRPGVTTLHSRHLVVLPAVHQTAVLVPAEI